jgi:hypothetical protein
VDSRTSSVETTWLPTDDVAQRSPATTQATAEALNVSRAASTAAENFWAHSLAADSMLDSVAANSRVTEEDTRSHQRRRRGNGPRRRIHPGQN